MCGEVCLFVHRREVVEAARLGQVEQVVGVLGGDALDVPARVRHAQQKRRRDEHLAISSRIIRNIHVRADAGQVQIMDDVIRVTAKKIDDLQSVIQLCRNATLGFPLQYENMRS